MRNTISQANTIRAYDLVKGNVAKIEAMGSYEKVAAFLSDELSAKFNSNNAKSILSAVIETGVKMELQSARKSKDPDKDTQLEELTGLMKAVNKELKEVSSELKRLADLYVLVAGAGSFSGTKPDEPCNTCKEELVDRSPVGLGFNSID